MFKLYNYIINYTLIQKYIERVTRNTLYSHYKPVIYKTVFMILQIV